MSIYSQHLSFEDFIKNEVKTLGLIQGYSSLHNHCSDLCTKSYIFFNQYTTLLKRTSQIAFNFACDFELVVEKVVRKVILEAHIEPDFAIATYALSICENNTDTNKVLRKFHFDFAPEFNEQSKKPVYHMQYGGEITPRIGELQFEYALEPWLSSPRINYMPINLALLIDMVLCEFSTVDTVEITEKAEWRNLIKHNEELILKNYFQTVRDFFNRDHKDANLYRDFYYGRPLHYTKTKKWCILHSVGTCQIPR